MWSHFVMFQFLCRKRNQFILMCHLKSWTHGTSASRRLNYNFMTLINLSNQWNRNSSLICYIINWSWIKYAIISCLFVWCVPDSNGITWQNKWNTLFILDSIVRLQFSPLLLKNFMSKSVSFYAETIDKYNSKCRTNKSCSTTYKIRLRSRISWKLIKFTFLEWINFYLPGDGESIWPQNWLF